MARAPGGADAHRPLAGRVALISGAGSGIGAGIARRFLAAGARVHGIGRRVEALRSVAPDALEAGTFVPHPIDVTDKAAVDELTGKLAEDDPIDILVCAAGINITDRRFHQLTDESFDEVVQTNLTGVFRLMRATMDQIRQRQGDIVLISSIAAAWPDHSGAAYGASKSALLGLARGASRDEHVHGVRVCTILPGIVDTPILDRRPSPPPDEVRALCLQPEDVAEAALCAVSLPNRANMAEISLVATRLQSLGNTQQATPPLPSAR
ncbi:SDR family oxidoreductase [Saccharopolyspora thermophila]|uniref:SDR family oxidoreductase n=1 Tax=Saccharopolyspora thermophila TaxID=89367 RepID=UPI001668CDDA|nr:SDR family oxidoreductase [Saccharopolyspora subtropica]